MKAKTYLNSDGSINKHELEKIFKEKGISEEHLMKQYQELSAYLRKNNKLK